MSATPEDQQSSTAPVPLPETRRERKRRKKKQRAIDSPMPTKLRETVESFGMAILMAIGLKYFLVEAYSIPSPSMQPTLLGSNAAGAYDRILVDKAAYLAADPDRWEIGVFRYPHNRSQNYVKRVVGMPGETLRIAGGDIHRRDAEGQLQVVRKPLGLQDAFWRRIWHQAGNEDPRAIIERGQGRWQDDVFVLEPEGTQTRTVRLGDPDWYRDHYGHGYPRSIERQVIGDVGGPTNAYGQNPTGDLRIALSSKLAEGWERLVLRISEQGGESGEREFELALERDGATTTARLSARAGAPIRETKPVSIAAGSWFDVELWHWDDQLYARVAGHELGPIGYESPAAALEAGSSVQVRLGVAGARAEFTDFEIDRDLYYLPSDAAGIDVVVPEGQYWMLGDNTQNSDDGRSWKKLTLSYDAKTKKLVAPGQGDAVVVGNSRVGSRDADQNPVFATPDGPLVFTDLHGEEHVLEASLLEFERLGYAGGHANGLASAPPHEPARFVPREYFLGRALAIFWPVGIGAPFRLGWIR